MNAVTLHATGDYFVTASADRTWAFYDVATGTCFTQARLPLADKALHTSVLLACCLMNRTLQIQSNVADFCRMIRSIASIATAVCITCEITSLGGRPDPLVLPPCAGV